MNVLINFYFSKTSVLRILLISDLDPGPPLKSINSDFSINYVRYQLKIILFNSNYKTIKFLKKRGFFCFLKVDLVRVAICMPKNFTKYFKSSPIFFCQLFHNSYCLCNVAILANQLYVYTALFS